MKIIHGYVMKEACNFGDDRKRNEDILKTGRGLTIKLSKNVLCFINFYLILYV